MELRPQTPEESRAVQSGEALDFEVGHGEFDRAFVIEAAPSSVVHVLLDEPTQLDHRQSGGLALSTEERFFVASTGALDEDGEHGVGAAAR
jgi:hypothetical protein